MFTHFLLLYWLICCLVLQRTSNNESFMPSGDFLSSGRAVSHKSDRGNFSPLPFLRTISLSL